MRQVKFNANGVQIIFSADVRLFPEAVEICRVDAITPTQHKHVGFDSNSGMKDFIMGLRNLADALEAGA